MKNESITNNVAIQTFRNLLLSFPIVGLLIIYILQRFNSLTNETVLMVILLVSLASANVASIESAKNSQEDNGESFFNFITMTFLWFAVYPFFILHQKIKNSGRNGIFAAILSFALIVGSLEMIRLGYASQTDVQYLELSKYILNFFCVVMIFSSPIIISNVLNSLKKDRVIVMVAFSVLGFVFVNQFSQNIAVNYIVTAVSVGLIVLSIKLSLQR